MQNISLSALARGQRGRVEAVDLSGGLGRRLRDLGLIPGSEVVCLHIAPAGSPLAFRIAGAVIALRREDCGRVALRRCP